MDVPKGSGVSSVRRQWQKIFDALVHMLKTQESQLESLVNDRKLLEDRVQIQHDRWLSDVHLLEDRICRMSKRLSQAEMVRLLEVAKSDLADGLNQREVFLFKTKIDHVKSDLEDLKLWLDHLTHKCDQKKNISQEGIKEIDRGKGEEEIKNMKPVDKNKEEKHHTKNLEDEVRRLKRSYENLSSVKNSEVSALLSERNFVWNQFKKMESDYTALLKSKRAEVQHANEKVEKLVASMGQLQSSNSEKDEIIRKLKANVAKLEEDAVRSNTEISRVSKELELLRNSHSMSVIPVLNRCKAEARTYNLESKKGVRDRRRQPVKKESAGPLLVSVPVKITDKGSKRSSKRRKDEVIPDTSKLFSSSFKVPKLKNPSLLTRVS